MADQNEKQSGGFNPVGLCIGAGIGLCYGVAMDNIALGLCYCVALGRKRGDDEK